MKHRTLIFGFIIFVLALCFFTFLIFKLAFGAELRNPKIIVLCFDDGPRPYVLKELLPILEKYGVSGTFFVMGWAVPQIQAARDLDINGFMLWNANNNFTVEVLK